MAKVNRFGVKVARGLFVRAHLPRGTVTQGIVAKFDSFGVYGKRAILDNGHNVGIDDVLYSAPVLTVSVVVRRDRETRAPVLFFVNSDPTRGYWIDCYARIGQHSEASREYMHACEPMRELDEEARALVREWEQQGEPCRARVVSRLTAPRGVSLYIGS